MNQHSKKPLHIKSSINPNLKRTLIVGSKMEAINLYEKILNYPALGFHVCGFTSIEKIQYKSIYRKLNLLGELRNLKKIVKANKIDIVLIALRSDQQAYLKNIIHDCNICKVNYQIVPDVYDTAYGDMIKDIYKDLIHPKKITFRWIIDFLWASFLLILFAPVFIVIAILIKIESPGNVFYSQLRIGENGRPFRIYKFRSMILDAEKKSGPVVVVQDDPRITNIGYFLRGTRIDELPQLINIIKGDMSFIGPKPERPFFVESFKRQIPLYTNRLKVKPGLTGWEQVKWGHNSSLNDIKEKIAYDLYYINNRSFWFDLKIILLTIKKIASND